MSVEKEVERLRNDLNALLNVIRAMPGGIQVLGDVQRVLSGTEYDGGIFVPLGYDDDHPVLIPTGFNGDAFSTVASNTAISVVAAGVPAGVKAVSLRARSRDDASASTSGAGINLTAISSNTRYALGCICGGLPNNYSQSAGGVVPCDADGNVYYITTASGVGTLDVWIEIWGYWL